MERTKQTMLAQLIARAVIFALFLLAIFIVVPSLRYLLILFIIVNLTLGTINGKRNIPANIVFIWLAPTLFIPVLEYLATAILFIITGVHLLRFYLWYKDGGIVEKKKEKDKGKKKFHILGLQIALPIIILICLILFILFILFIVALFSFVSVGGGVG